MILVVVEEEQRVKKKNLNEGHVWVERKGGDESREGEKERELKLPFLFPQHQLCGFYEKQMFTT